MRPLQAWHNLVGDTIAERQCVNVFDGRNGNRHNRCLIGVETCINRLADVTGERIADGIYLFADVSFGLRDVRTLVELEHKNDLPIRRCRRDMFDAADGVDDLFNRFGDLLDHTVRAGTGITDGHRDNRDVDFGEQIDWDARIRKDAKGNRQQHQHRDEHRLSDSGI